MSEIKRTLLSVLGAGLIVCGILLIIYGIFIESSITAAGAGVVLSWLGFIFYKPKNIIDDLIQLFVSLI